MFALVAGGEALLVLLFGWVESGEVGLSSGDAALFMLQVANEWQEQRGSCTFAILIK